MSSIWGAIEPAESISGRLRLDFGLRPAILRFNEWAVPGLGGAFFVRQLSWACMGLRLAQDLDGRASPARVAEGLEALASWIAVRQAKDTLAQEDRVQGKRKFAGVSSLSFNDVSRGGTYVTVPFRRAATRALPGLGFCKEEANFNALRLTQYGSELAESAMLDDGARKRIVQWLQAGTVPIHKVAEPLKKALLPEFATNTELNLVRTRVLADRSRETLAGLLHKSSDESLASVDGRERFLRGLTDGAMRERLASCFVFEDLRFASLAAAQIIANEIFDRPRPAAVLANSAEVQDSFARLQQIVTNLGALLPQDAPPEATAFCSEQAEGVSGVTRIVSLCSRVPMIFSVIGDQIDKGIGYSREIFAEEPFDNTEVKQELPIPVPRPLIRLRRLLMESGERFDHAR